MLRTALASLAAATVAVGLLPSAHAVPRDPGQPAATSAPGTTVAQVSDTPVRCEEPLLRSARPAWKVQRDQPRRFAAAARANGRRAAELARMAQDRSLWLDSCGRRLYVDQAPDETLVVESAAVSDTALPADVLALSSRPGAARTIYLDFTGDVLRDTYWNHELGLDSITMAPFSLDGAVDTAFSEAERRAIFDAWLVMAEDYAPFDIDVTTADPGQDALRRDSDLDQSYGSRVLVTSGGLINDWCGGCGGVAVVDVFGAVGRRHDYTQPALVFSGSVSGHGPWIGEVGSHEVGHHLGLEHDGGSFTPYYSGHGPWGPVMGSAYNRALSQWSRGEYAGATSQQDDVALIAAGAPHRPDDHGSADAPTVLEPGAPQDGVIHRRDDVDAFAFTASGRTVLQARPSSPYPNLDLGMTVLDADGTEVARLDPPVTVHRDRTVSGLDVTWQVQLPDSAADYVAVLEGVGYGDPAAGGYSDYGSLGSYQIWLTTEQPEPTPDPTAHPPSVLSRALELPATRLAAARLRTPYKVRISASGGSGSYHWRVRGDLPRGLRARVTPNGSALVLEGRPKRLGRERFRVVVRDDDGQRVVRRYVIRVRRQA